MKKLAFVLIPMTLIATACQSAPVPNLAARTPVNLQAANASPDLNASYSFRKPTGILKVDLYSSSDKSIAQEHIKTFFAKYVDKNDIFNYQTLQNDTETDKFVINVYGGNKDFVYKKILQDLKFYLNQRMRFDSLNTYTGS